MATNPKQKRLWIKQEKRIVRLLYKKGLLTDFKVSDLYWAEYKWINKKKYKSKHSKYKYPVYMPEVHYGTTDYWGEGDEHSIVSTILEHLYWDNIDDEDSDPTPDDFPKSTFNNGMSRQKLIKYLSKLPTKVNSNKINKILKTQTIDE
jgi:hypothetical protein